MKSFVIFLLLLVCENNYAQSNRINDEDFVNAISKLVVDSSFSHYYLCANAAPCSFKKFDYDEWYKYGLQQDVPFYILNELAKNSFLKNAPQQWKEEKLQHAICIDEEKAKAILSQSVKHHVKNNGHNSLAGKIVFYFSRPSFTHDGQYAIIDMGFRCDDQQCGMGATFLFKQVSSKWQLAGKKIAWGN